MPVRDDTIAILIGTSKTKSSLLELYEVRNNIEAMFRICVDEAILGIPARNIFVCFDEERNAIIDRVGIAAARQAKRFILYYSGHGVIDADSGSGLVLTCADTTNNTAGSGLGFDMVRSAVRRTTADQRVLLLDCCFSGQALLSSLADRDSVEHATIAPWTKEARGSLAIAASGEFETAKRAQDRTSTTTELTAFTGALHRAFTTPVHESTPVDASLLIKRIRQFMPPDAPEPKVAVSDESVLKMSLFSPRTDGGRHVATTPKALLAEYVRSIGTSLVISAVDPALNNLAIVEQCKISLREGVLPDMRHHYIGPSCAERWVALTRDESYRPGSLDSLLEFVRTQVADVLCKRWRHGRAVSLISLGSGDGIIDARILNSLQTAMATRTGGEDSLNSYFPVDISWDLLQLASRSVAKREYPAAITTLPILADLSRLAAVTKLWRHSPDIEVYSFLGKTLGNFKNETLVILPIAQAMMKEDLLLLDARCYAGRLSNATREGLAMQYDNDANYEFAAGPLSVLSAQVEAQAMSVNVVRPATPMYSVIPRTWTVVTELALTNESRRNLGIVRPVGSMSLSWSNVYHLLDFEKWLTDLGLRVLCRAGTPDADEIVECYYLLEKADENADNENVAKRRVPRARRASSVEGQ
ncbi:MAG: hypothetical protein JWO36_3359 [Myxococcales bacterium]|nr:hypothetical protein [Myxococcales bacterium]